MTSPRSLAAPLATPPAAFGAMIFRFVEEFGRFAHFALLTARWMLLAPSRWARPRLLLPQFYTVGVASIPVVAITGAFIGMILALESYQQFLAVGIEDRLGGVINISVTKQIGPVLAAVMVAGRVGGALAAELGTMRVTEQLDAMRAMAADPIPYLVVPRFVACLVMTPILTIYSDLLGVWGGWLVTVRFYGVPASEYWAYSSAFVGWWEPTTGLIKALVFGASIGMIACYKGFTCGSGAAGVGRAATESFVASFLAIIAINLVLAKFLNTIGEVFVYGGAGFAALE
ncbi:MAG TPA: ABC transporter permease [Phycisphaerales bacterium]|nr:ABC transporter permease [Phycisphaerales bacterium]HMP36494.1 ABC transporter permease [Phycisphaerales bacterium]